MSENTLRTLGFTISRGEPGNGYRQARSIIKAVEEIEKIRDSLNSDKNEISVGKEWLCDNFYMIQREGLMAARNFKSIKELTGCIHDGRQGSAIMLLSHALCGEADYKLTERSIEEGSRAFLEEFSLKTSEIALLPSAIAGELCFEISRLGNMLLGKGKNKEDSIGGKIGNCVTSLRFISTMYFEDLFNELCPIERILRLDPSGVYPKMSLATRNRYRYCVEQIARLKGITEIEAAKEALHFAQEGKCERDRHIGRWILENDYIKEERTKRGKWYFSWIMILSFALSIPVLWVENGGLLFILFLFLGYEGAKIICDRLMLKGIGAMPPPRMDFFEGIPDNHRTMMVISALLTGEKSVQTLLLRLEEYYLANKYDNLYFGILGDLKESSGETAETDEIIINSAKEGIADLNKRYGDRFCLFIRKRVYNEKQGKYMAWERKRGAIVNLLNYFSNENPFETVICSDRAMGCKYLITLDADTRPFIDALIGLTEGMSHPLNRPVIDREKGRVIKGYGIIQPKVLNDILSSSVSWFSKVIGGIGGIDSYCDPANDIYQDLFYEGIFCGKGIMDIEASKELITDMVMDNTLLSHDIVEGGILRCGLLSDVWVSDGVPSNPLSWFSRLHRWTRGDWQNIIWLMPFVKNKYGEKYKNPLSALSKYKIADNLRRSLIPAAELIALFVLLTLGGGIYGWLLWWGLFLLPVFVSIKVSNGMIGLRTHSPLFRPVWSAFINCMYTLFLMPYWCYVQLSAVFITLYRVLISKRNMLQWMTAAQGDKAKKELFGVYWEMISCPVLGILAFAFSENRYIGLIFCGVWVIAPYLAYKTGERNTEDKTVSINDRKFLTECARMMWGYFAENMGPENHYLPPDNIQIDPYNGIAKRTSPTNIGMALLSVLSAYDFGFIDRDEMIDRVEKTIGTLENLEKWNGHLYNWYDLEKAQVMRPKYVSVADSGNLIGSLITVKEGLLELNETELAKRIEKLIDECDFSPLYNKKRKMFAIGYNEDLGQWDSGSYDLLASEARQASYIAAAMRQVPKEHWFALSRSMSKGGGYTGLMSWSGTMFEYFMPSLLLPEYEGSLLFESLWYCLYCQKLVSREESIPWGISECAFYAFDPFLNYQYKAFGVQRLGLKRGLDRERVIAPYATFLTLPLDHKDGVENLRQQQDKGYCGKYGHYEAVDFTRGRAKGEGNIVKCFMAHHVGMSIVSVANLLFSNIHKKRFLSDPRMRAHTQLLQEKAPKEIMLTNIPEREPQRDERFLEEQEVLVRAFTDMDIFSPNINLLGSRDYSVMLSDSGAGMSVSGEILVAGGEIETGHEEGVYFFIIDRDNDKIHSMTYAPFYEDDGHYRTVFTPHCTRFECEFEDLRGNVEVIGGAGGKYELRRFELYNKGKTERRFDICVYFEPVLNESADYKSHPVFSDMFLEITEGREENSIIIRRRSRGGEKKDCFGTFVPFGVLARKPQFETKRESIYLGSFKDGLKGSFGGLEKNPIYPCICIRSSVVLAENSTVSGGFALSFGDKKEQAIEEAETAAKTELLLLKELAYQRTVAEDTFLKLTSSAKEEILKRLPPLFVRGMRMPIQTQSIENNRLSRHGLWSVGISGDYPICIMEYDDKNEDLLNLFLTAIRFLLLRGVRVDGAVLYKEKGEYRKETRSILKKIVCQHSMEGFLSQRGGIHLIPTGEDSSVAVLLYAASDLVFSSEFEKKKEKHEKLSGLGILLSSRYKFNGGTDGLECSIPFGGVKNGGYFVVKSPKRPFAHILANRSMGAVVTDRSGGYTFYKNARENKLTIWSNDPVLDLPSELLFLKEGEGIYPLGVSGAQYYPGYACFTGEINGTLYKIYDFIHPYFPVRIRHVEFINKTDENRIISLGAYAHLLMGARTPENRFIKTWEKDGLLLASNPYNADFSRQTVFMSGGEIPKSYTFSQYESLQGRMGKGDGDRVFCAEWEIELAPKGTGDKVILFGVYENEKQKQEILRRCSDADGVKKALCDLKEFYKAKCGAIEIDTPDKELNELFNIFLSYQTLACRMYAKTSLYQCGGAFGYRDQLQDSLAMLYSMPELTWLQILRCAVHQFVEGDVQHWWHPIKSEKGKLHRGIRTRHSDSHLWLAYAVLRYLEVTKDYELLSFKTPYSDGEELKEGEKERYFIPNVSELKESIYDHCIRAIERARNYGVRGLCLIGTGDWNDGMNRVGVKGTGESIWLSWFLAAILRDFSTVCEKMGDMERAGEYKEESKRLFASIEENGWDGEWYLRAFYDDGTPLGSKACEECRMDSIAQSFSVLSKNEASQRGLKAIESADGYLCDRDKKVVRLLYPPFENTIKDPGYIKGYPPGARENGGQYTHAAIWLACAFFEAGNADKGYEILSLINPLNKGAEYMAEPYVLAGDVHLSGRAGWTWYTGASGWYYRCVAEWMFGLKAEGDYLKIDPRLPQKLLPCKVKFRYKGTQYNITFSGGRRIKVDGFFAEGNKIPLANDGSIHEVEVL